MSPRTTIQNDNRKNYVFCAIYFSPSISIHILSFTLIGHIICKQLLIWNNIHGQLTRPTFILNCEHHGGKLQTILKLPKRVVNLKELTGTDPDKILPMGGQTDGQINRQTDGQSVSRDLLPPTTTTLLWGYNHNAYLNFQPMQPRGNAAAEGRGTQNNWEFKLPILIPDL